MIVADTSAIIAILFQEADGSVFARRMVRASRVLMSAATVTEAAIVAFSKLGGYGLDGMTAILRDMKVDVRDLDATQSTLAIEAYRRFGRGTGHPARLNFGDCFSYALARSLDLPLLFKGDDFVHTDLRSAMVNG